MLAIAIARPPAETAKPIVHFADLVGPKLCEGKLRRTEVLVDGHLYVMVYDSGDKLGTLFRGASTTRQWIAEGHLLPTNSGRVFGSLFRELMGH